MSTGLTRFTELFRLQGRDFTVQDGSLFLCENYTVRQFAATTEQKIVNKSQVDSVLRELRGYIYIGQSIIEDTDDPQWYAVVCEKGFSVDEYPLAKTRSEVKRSLKRCSVRKVTGAEIADQIYDVMTDAMRDQYYKPTEIQDKQRYQERFHLLDSFPDIVDIWGVFCEDELAGIAQNYKFGQLEVNYSSIKFKPRLLSHCSSYGLIHTMNEYYLKAGNVKLVNDGYRNIYHKTTIQQVLQKHFQFYKMPMILQAQFRQPVRLFVNALSPFQILINKISPKAEAIFTLNSIAKGFQHD